MTNFHFLRPDWLTILIPMIFIIGYCIRQRMQHHAWERVCDPHLLKHLLLSPKHPHTRSVLYLLIAAWFLLAIALAGPTWSRVSQGLFRSTASTVIAVELTPTLYARDIEPNRLARVRFKIQDMLKHNKEGQIGMVAFSSEAYVVSPLTQDAATITSMVNELDPNIMPVMGGSIANGLLQSAQLLQQSGITSGHIIVVTDNKPSARDFEVARDLSNKGFRISVLAIGTSQGAPIPTDEGFLKDEDGNTLLAKLDEAGLRQLAKAGGGDYVHFTNNDDDINFLLSNHDQELQLRALQVVKATAHWKDEGRWLVILCLPLAALSFRRGWFERIIK